MADEFIEIHWTSGSLEEARKVCRQLVEGRQVACAQIVPWIESVYMWNNQLETSQESKVVLKTRADKFDKVRDIIEKECSYDVPEITMVNIDGGNQGYLDWMRDSTAALG